MVLYKEIHLKCKKDLTNTIINGIIELTKQERREKNVLEKIIALAISISTLVHLYYQVKTKRLEIKKLKLEIKKLRRE